MQNKLFINARERSFSLLPLKSKQHLLFVGVRTGEDFRFLPSDVHIKGIDLSQDMLNKNTWKTYYTSTSECRAITISC